MGEIFDNRINQHQSYTEAQAAAKLQLSKRHLARLRKQNAGPRWYKPEASAKGYSYLGQSLIDWMVERTSLSGVKTTRRRARNGS